MYEEKNVVPKNDNTMTSEGANHSRVAVWGILGSALLLRLILAPLPGYENDIYSFGTWMRAAVDYGVSHIYQTVPWCDYPPGYLYLLKAVGCLWKLVTNSPIPADNTIAMRFLVKIVPIIADIAGAGVLYRIAAPRVSRNIALALLISYAFNPALIFNSVVWGQVDSLTALLVLLSLWCILSHQSGIAFALATIAILIKFQAVVIVPVLLIGAYVLEGGKGIRAAYKGCGSASLALLLAFFLTRHVESVISVATGAVGRYPNISMHAHNLWWIIGGKASPSISDAKRIGNAILSYHDIGLIVFGTISLIILWRLWRDLRRKSICDPAPPLLLAATAEMMAFYLFPTQMHERYIVPAIITSAALCIWKPNAWWLYGIFSLGVFVSLASTLQTIYPGNIGAVGKFFPAGREDTYVISVLFLALFLILLFWTKDRRFVFYSFFALTGAAVIMAITVSAPLKTSQILSQWKPVEQQQDWGKIHYNRTVEDRRLSVAGFVFHQGIGTHANSRLIYHLNGAFREFDTAFGIDDEVNHGQKAQFRILADGLVRFDSGIIPAGGWPRHIHINIEGTQYLTLEVLDGGDGINYDHVDWLEPTLFR